MNNVGELSFPQRDVCQANARFEVSAIEVDNFLQRASRVRRVTTLQKTLANQRQQNGVVLRAHTCQAQRCSRSRQQTRIRLRARLRTQQSREVVDEPRAVRSDVQRAPKSLARFSQTARYAQFVAETTKQKCSFQFFRGRCRFGNSGVALQFSSEFEIRPGDVEQVRRSELR